MTKFSGLGGASPLVRRPSDLPRQPSTGPTDVRSLADAQVVRRDVEVSRLSDLEQMAPTAASGAEVNEQRGTEGPDRLNLQGGPLVVR